MGDKKHLVIVFIAVGLAIVSLTFALITAILQADFTGCIMRYNKTDSSWNTTTASVSITANANYDLKNSSINSQGRIKPNDSDYGKWKKADFEIIKGSKISFEVNGQISLCKSYYPETNLGTNIEIPRIDDQGVGLPIILDAKNGKSWKKVAEIFNKDRLMITVGENSKNENEQIYQLNDTSDVHSGNCGDGQTSYAPVCGKYSFYLNSSYAASCIKATVCPSKPIKCTKTTSDWMWDDQIKIDPKSLCCSYKEQKPNKCTAKCCNDKKWIKYITSGWATLLDTDADVYYLKCKKQDLLVAGFDIDSNPLPQRYQENYIFEYDANNIPDKRNDYVNSENICPDNLPKDVRSWFAFEVKDSQNSYKKKNSGLYYKMGQEKEKIASLISENNLLIFDGRVAIGQNKGYFQYGFYDKGTGGYVIYLKHSKCYRENGEYFEDVYANRGAIKYVLLSDKQNPNKEKFDYDVLGLDKDGKSKEFTADKDGFFWFLINNKQEDYKDSKGIYGINITQKTKGGDSAGFNIPNIIYKNIIVYFKDLAKHIFANLVCYASSPNEGNINENTNERQASCSSFFMYVHAGLTLYVLVYAFSFLLGGTRINTYDLVTRIIKVVIIGGLINQKTFIFFNEYVFDLVFVTTDGIMGSINGYSTKVSNLHSHGDIKTSVGRFLDSIFQILFPTSNILSYQVLALLGTGLSGFIFFILIFVALVIFCISLFIFIVVYIESMLIVALNIGLAPIFLPFSLFEATNYLFTNWLKVVLSHIFRPIILFAGLVIFSKLFLIYLDYALNYSVCWKCVNPFQVPFIGNYFPIFKTLEKMPIFCIDWFVPWGYNPLKGNSIGMCMSHIIALLIISFGLYKYTTMSQRIVTNIFDTLQEAKLYKKSAQGGYLDTQIRDKL